MKTMIISLLLLTSLASALPNDLTGTVVKTDGENSLWINITEPNEYNLMGVVQVLLSRPEEGLQSFVGDELQFDVLGRDILGRPVVEAYYRGVPIGNILTPPPAVYRELVRKGLITWDGQPVEQYKHYVVESAWASYGWTY